MYHSWRKEALDCPGAGVTGSYEALDMGAGNQTQIP